MSLKIIIDTPGPFYPGSKIQGRLICSFDNSQKLRGIKMRAYGEEHTEWRGTQSYYCQREKKHKMRSVLCKGDNDLFRLESLLFGGHTGDHHLGPGTFTYPFSFQLPLNLPSTFDNKYGHVRYTLKGIVDVPWGIDFTEKLHFDLFSIIDLNSFPIEAFQPVSRNDGKTISCCCFPGGRITVDINISKTAFVPGETIKLFVALTNMSNTNVESLDAKLVQQIGSVVHTPKYDSKKEAKTLASMLMSGVGAHGETKYDIGIPIPADIAVPNLDRCTLFEVVHDVEISANIPGFHTDLDLSFTVNIGHIQNNSQLNGSPPAAQSKDGGVLEVGYQYPGDPYAPPGGGSEYFNGPSASGAPYPPASAPAPLSSPGEPPYSDGSQRTTHRKEKEAMEGGVPSAAPNELPPPSYSEVTRMS